MNGLGACSTIVYELAAACGLCQNATFIPWPQWSFFCPAQITSDGAYPLPIPTNTSVPRWAFIGPDTYGGNFNATAAKLVGGTSIYYPASC